MIIAVDFDHTIHDTDHPKPGRRMGPPIVGAIDALTQLKEQGHTIIVHSVWGSKKDIIGDWMSFYNIPYDDITNIKPEADIYIDNKGYHFITWSQTLEDIL